MCLLLFFTYYQLKEKIRCDFSKFRKGDIPVSFQNLYFVNGYLKRYIKRDFSLYNFLLIDEVKQIISLRHVNTHNVGFIDEKYESQNRDLVKMNPKAVFVMEDEDMFKKSIELIQLFVNYIDLNLRSTR